MINRRELIKQVALLTGAAVIGSEFFLSGCNSDRKEVSGLFNENDISQFDEIAETILPRTNTPGAKDAKSESSWQNIQQTVIVKHN